MLHKNTNFATVCTLFFRTDFEIHGRDQLTHLVVTNKFECPDDSTLLDMGYDVTLWENFKSTQIVDCVTSGVRHKMREKQIMGHLRADNSSPTEMTVLERRGPWVNSRVLSAG